jgi:glycosyltransferase involved in cell wall biosynthesis
VAMCLSFVSEVLPLVQAEMPEVRLLIVGKDPPAEVRALAENPAVTVTGTVEDIRPYLQKATLAVAPLAYGTGIQNKVLEAMACATPVVASSQAVAALNVINGRDVIIADAPHEMAHAMLTLLNNIHRRQAVGMAGRRYVEENHRWQNIAARLEEIYDGIIGN